MADTCDEVRDDRGAAFAVATASANPVISVGTDDIEGAYEDAQRLGDEIVYPITTESWGVRRFFVRAPDGNILNIVNHRG